MPVLFALSLLGCQPVSTGPDGGGDSAGPPVAAPALITDLDGSAWFLGDPATGTVQTRFDLSEAHPDECGDPSWCMLYQARERIAADGRPEVVYTYSPTDESDGDSLGRDDRHGRVVAVDAETLVPRWRLEALDFGDAVDFRSGAGDAVCRADPADPCRPAADTSDREYHACHLYQPHDLWVSAEDEAGVQLWIADTRNARVLRVRLDRGETCGEVELVLDGAHPDWDVYNAVNSFELRETADGRELLMSVKDTFSRGAGEAQRGGDGRGKILLWRDAGGDDWGQVWEHPPALEGAENFVNAPHGVSWWEQDGQQLVAYAHSLGRGSDWDRGEGGSVGVLRIEEDVPVYLFDADVPGRGLMYTRDTLPLAGGRVLVTDSGCKRGLACPHPTGTWLVDLPDLPAPDGRTGAWTADGDQQRFLELQPAGPLQFQEAVGLYSAEWPDRAP